MTTIDIPTSLDLALLRNKNHTAQIFGTFHNPDTIWAAVINDTVSRGDTAFNFAGGTGSLFGAIEGDMTVWIGTTVGSNDVGKLRVRAISSGDGGVTGTLTVATHVLSIQNGYFLTFKNTHELWAKYPYLNTVDPDNLESTEFLKDYDIPYTNQNQNIKPVVIAGSHQAKFIYDIVGYWRVISQLPDSYTLAPGATITNYAATCVPSTGVTISINASTGYGYVEFTQPGQYWVKYTITDSNGATESSYRYYYAHSQDPSNAHYPHVDFTISNITGDWSTGGWSTSLDFHDNIALTNIPDEALTIIWAEYYFDTEHYPITLLPNECTNLITGYLRIDRNNEVLTTGVNKVNCTVNTVENLLANHFMFSVSLEAVNHTPNYWYEYRAELTNGRAVHHFWRWHSTLMQICDVVGLDYNSDLRAFAEMEDGTLYTMADDILLNKGINTHVVADKGGRLWLTPDIQLLNDTERAALDTIFEITEDDQSGDVIIGRNQPDRTVFTKVSGFYWDGSFITSATDECPNPPCPDVEPFCSSAPTDLPGDDGPSVTSHDNQTLSSQNDCNELAGRFYAKENNLYPEYQFTTHGNYSGVFDVAYPVFWYTSIIAERGFTWVDKNLICRNVSININQLAGTINCAVVFEPEMQGEDGVAGYCLDNFSVTNDGVQGDVDTLGSLIITGSSVYTRAENIAGWDLKTSEAVSDLIKDPFLYVKDSSIVLRSGVGYIKRSTDAGNTWTDVTPAIDPPNDSGDTPAPTAATVDYFNIAGSQININEFVYQVRWQNSGGNWRTWLLYTDDDHGTYTWQSVTGSGVIGNETDYDSTGVTISGVSLTPVVQSLDTSKVLAMSTSSATYTVAFSYGEVSGTTITTIDGNVDPPAGYLDPTQGQSFICPLQNNRAFVGWAAIVAATTPVYYLGIIDVSTGVIQWKTNMSFPGFTGGERITAISLGNYGGNDYIALSRYISVAGPTPDIIEIIPITIDSLNAITLSSATTVVTAGAGEGLGILGLSKYGPQNLPNWFDFVILYKQTTLAAETLYKVLPLRLNIGTLIVSSGTVSTIHSLPYLTTTPNIATTHTVTQVATDSNYLVGMTYDNAPNNLCVNSFYVDHVSQTVTVGDQLTRSAIFGMVALATGSNNKVVFAESNTIYSFTVQTPSLVLTDNADDIVLTSGTTRNSITALTGDQLVASDGATLWLVTFTTGGGPIKGLGGVIDRVYSFTYYLTAWNNGELELRVHDLPSLTSITTTQLGSASESEVDNYTYWAYPEVDYANDANVYVYGRMANIDGGLAHIAVSSDYGATLTTLNNSYTTQRVSALIVNVLGDFYYITSNGTLSKFYKNFVYQSDLTFAKSTNPHALKWHGGTIYCCAAGAGATMVIRGRQPFAVWSNITENHGTANGIDAIEIL